jgi:hypothetical protein
MVRYRPAVVADVLSSQFKLDLPAWDRIRLESNDVSEPKPAVFLADAPVALTAADGKHS